MKLSDEELIRTLAYEAAKQKVKRLTSYRKLTRRWFEELRTTSNLLLLLNEEEWSKLLSELSNDPTPDLGEFE